MTSIEKLEAEKREYERLYQEALLHSPGDTARLDALRDSINQLDRQLKHARAELAEHS
jgi:hypothetical protein